MGRFLEIESGKIVESSTKDTIHVADGNLHFWPRGQFCYSIHLGDSISAEGYFFDSGAEAYKNNNGELKIWFENLEQPGSKYTNYTLFVDVGYSRFEVCNLKPEFFNTLKEFVFEELSND